MRSLNSFNSSMKFKCGNCVLEKVRKWENKLSSLSEKKKRRFNDQKYELNYKRVINYVIII